MIPSIEFTKKYLNLESSNRNTIEDNIKKIEWNESNAITFSTDRQLGFTYDNNCRLYFKKSANNIILLDFMFRRGFGST